MLFFRRLMFFLFLLLFGWRWSCWCWWFGCYCCCFFCCCCFCFCCCYCCCWLVFVRVFSSIYRLPVSTLPLCRYCPKAPDLACLVRLPRLLLLLLWVWWSFEGRILQNGLSACSPNRVASCLQHPPSNFDPCRQWYEVWLGSPPYLGTYLLCSYRVPSRMPI